MVQPISIFHYQAYKPFLVDQLARQGRGAKSALSAALSCRPSYLTQILTGKAHLSAEQAERVARHLGLDAAGKHYLFSLVHRERASTAELREYYTGEILSLRERHLQFFTQSAVIRPIREEDESIDFCANWHYAAVLLMTESPRFQTADALARALKLPLDRVQAALDYLVTRGHIRLNATSGRYVGNPGRHITSPRAPTLQKIYRGEWLLKTHAHLQADGAFETFFNSVMMCSREHVEELKRDLARVIARHSERVEKSSPDFLFRLGIQLHAVAKPET